MPSRNGLGWLFRLNVPDIAQDSAFNAGLTFFLGYIFHDHARVTVLIRLIPHKYCSIQVRAFFAFKQASFSDLCYINFY